MSNKIESVKELVITKDQEYVKYVNGEITMNKGKILKRRNEKEYEDVAQTLLKYVNGEAKMLCLGVRNEHESKSFTKFLASKNVQVFSQDISHHAKADFTCDFNYLSKHVPNDEFNILYSNALDHAIDSTAAFQDWLKVVKSGGIICLGFVLEGIGDHCTFTHKSVTDYMTNSSDLKFLEWTEKKPGDTHYFCRKV
jgi:hypothetical protein